MQPIVLETRVQKSCLASVEKGRALLKGASPIGAEEVEVDRPTT
eukprot:CAMPEP_0206545504 /NCGR_PEP_ID=MMETSP0325_2-20121206/12174_1 /ASSEMBLY_ACC=CAM_ASM_000347 /TAXON_ID=2866 /ORGANISM="Crypthecodinium cohnii, Strain Seligo" /LENGTH=43 /DNA_ID= /DNA_START= /DNA_END= /DNA_ORIENTATION=